MNNKSNWLDRELHHQTGVETNYKPNLTIREVLKLIGKGEKEASNPVSRYRNRKFDAEIAANEVIAFKAGRHTQEKDINKLIQQSKDATKLAGDLKKALPAVCFSGLFNGNRNKENFIPESCTGIFVVDIDKLEPTELKPVKEKLMSIPECAFVFLSPSEMGFKAGFEVDFYRNDKQYKHVFQFLKEFLLKEHNIILDESGKDVSRLCFISLDDDIYIRTGEGV